MLKHEIKVGPLEYSEYTSILNNYNKQTNNQINIDSFLHWIARNHNGACLHSILRNRDDEIVGHCCIFPFFIEYNSSLLKAGKAEYLFLLPEYRSMQTENYSINIPAYILLNELYKYALKISKYNFIIISAPIGVNKLHISCGAKSLNFSLHECIMINNPLDAALFTPNINIYKKVILFFVGIFQKIFSPIAFFLFSMSNQMKKSYIDTDEDLIGFNNDEVFIKWRYPKKKFTRFKNDKTDVFLKNGSKKDFLRVCQINKMEDNPAVFIKDCLRISKEQNSLGFRISVYDNSPISKDLIKKLRLLGFLVAKREREILIVSDNDIF